MKKSIAIFYAVLAAAFYAINMPFSKLLLEHVPSTIMAGLLYIGAGLGIGAMFAVNIQKTDRGDLLSKKDLPYVIGMIVLDILAPIFLMYGLLHTTSATASLLNNFEIAATAVIALAIFKETVSPKLWLSIAFVTVSSVILSFENISELKLSWGAIFVLLAAVCWAYAYT